MFVAPKICVTCVRNSDNATIRVRNPFHLIGFTETIPLGEICQARVRHNLRNNHVCRPHL